MSLSDKSASEISELLTQYGIKHGPIVESTRKLYERKLEKAMDEAAPETSSADKTYYREEEEEVTYITYHSPTRHEGSGDMLKHRGATESNYEQKDDDGKESELDREPLIQSTITKTNYSAVQSKGPVKKSQGGCLGKTIRLLLVFALLAAVSYYVFCHVMSNEGSKQLQN